MQSFKTAIAEAIKQYQWKEIETRGQRWIETLDFHVVCKLPTETEIFRVYRHADPYIARARTEYIVTQNPIPLLIVTTEEDDINTRRAIVLEWDWSWRGHPWCVIGIQAMYRFPDMHYFLMLRSSNLYNALPYDLHAVACGFAPEIKKFYYEKFDMKKPEKEILHIYATNAHVFKEEWDEFLKLFRVSGVKYEEIPEKKQEKKPTKKFVLKEPKGQAILGGE